LNEVAKVRSFMIRVFQVVSSPGFKFTVIITKLTSEELINSLPVAANPVTEAGVICVDCQ
jgi:hypothetical protein